MRHHKMVLIFNAVYRHKTVSRDQLTREVDVSSASISTSINGLLSSGVMRVSGERPSRGGRRAEILELNETSRYLVGVDLQGRRLRIGLVDLAGNIHSTNEKGVDFDQDLTFNHFLGELKTFLSRLSETQTAQLLAVGIGTPEMLDRQAETMISSNRVPWLGVPVREITSRETGLPAYLARSVDGTILGEKWFGAAHDADHSLVVTLGGGLGCGMIFDNELYAGASLMAGELGHITLVPDGPDCYCGKRGCLEMFVAENKIIANYFQEKQEPAPPGFTFAQLTEAARAGDCVAMAQIHAACSYLGLGISHLIQILNPEQIILGGILSTESDLFLPEIRKTIGRHTIPMLADATRIVTSDLGLDAGLKGAAAFALQQLIDCPEGTEALLDPTVGRERLQASVRYTSTY
jgi:N-acetylglucosamine repressor